MAAETAVEDEPKAEAFDFSDMKHICESDVGITEFANPQIGGFNAIIKHRYSDFNVHELDKATGQPVPLTNEEPPVEKNNPKDLEAKMRSFKEVAYAQLEAEEKTLISPLSYARILQLAKTFTDPNKPPESESVNIDITKFENDKAKRKLLHEFMRKYFPQLASSTSSQKVGGVDKRFFSVTFKKVVDDMVDKKHDNWPRDRPTFLHFTLYKENQDFIQIAGEMCRMLFRDQRISQKFGFAGNKDKRGRTVQRISVKRITARRLIQVASNIWVNSSRNYRRIPDKPAVVVSDFSYEKEAIELGQLKGNRFTLVLRNIDAKPENITKSIQDLKSTSNDGLPSFLNYYGLQRFGTATVLTSDIGKAILKDQWEKAAELILKPRPGEKPKNNEIRGHWWKHRDAKTTLKMIGQIRGFGTIEGNVIRALADNGNRYDSSMLSKVHKNSRIFYVHAYQSFVFNKVLSKRVKKFGVKVLVGDLVEDTSIPEEKENGTDVGENGQNKDIPNGEESSTKEDEKKVKRDRIKLKRVTEENIDEIKPEDVLITVPGFDVEYPDNETKSFYEEVLAEDEMNFESFVSGSREYSCGGDYRKMLAKVDIVDHRFIKYTDPNKDLVISAYDEFKGRPQVADEGEEAPYTALILSFDLSSSCYATMAMREIMKCDTGKENQTALTDAHVADAIKRGFLPEKKEEDGEGEPDAKRQKTE